MSNDLYTPSCATSCDDEVLGTIGNTECATAETVEIAEISEIYLSNKSGTAGTPENPILTYSAGGNNETNILTWYGTKDNAGASTLRFLYGQGEKPEATESTVTIEKGKIVSIGTPRHPFTFAVNIIDQETYEFLRKLQACKGQFHLWYTTDTYLYGGGNGIIVDVEKVSFPKTGGRGSQAQAIITFGWSAKADPIRDLKPW